MREDFRTFFEKTPLKKSKHLSLKYIEPIKSKKYSE